MFLEWDTRKRSNAVRARPDQAEAGDGPAPKSRARAAGKTAKAVKKTALREGGSGGGTMSCLGDTGAGSGVGYQVAKFV